MPFLFGPAPIRRTIKYLESGKLIFKDRVKVMALHYNMYFRRNDKPLYDAHQGMRDFYFWHIPHIQYKNPNIQIVRFLELTPTPFIRCWFDNGQDILFDCDSKSKEQILNQLIKILGKSQERLAMEANLNVTQLSVDNPSIFGFGRTQYCMCEIPGQVPCPGVVPLPKRLRGKYKYFLKEELEKEEREFEELAESDAEKQFEQKETEL